MNTILKIMVALAAIPYVLRGIVYLGIPAAYLLIAMSGPNTNGSSIEPTNHLQQSQLHQQPRYLIPDK